MRLLGSFVVSVIILYIQDKIQKGICAPRSLVFWRLESLYGYFFMFYFFAFLFTEPDYIGLTVFLGLILLPLPLTFYYHFDKSGLTCQRFLFKKFYSWDQVDRVKLEAFISQRYGSELEYILVFKNGFQVKSMNFLPILKISGSFTGFYFNRE